MPFQKGNNYGALRKKTKHSKETKEKISASVSKTLIGNTRRLGTKHSEGTKKKMSESHTGEKNPCWIKDRTKVKRDGNRDCPLHKQWSRSVKNRDHWKCKINNCDCSGNVVAHHILPYKDYKELRYDINNGITLCKFHHPRKRQDEIDLIRPFQEIIRKLNRIVKSNQQ